jgi:hypothetical protein
MSKWGFAVCGRSPVVREGGEVGNAAGARIALVVT